MNLRNPISRLFTTSTSIPPITTLHHFPTTNLIAMESVRELHAYLIRQGLHTNPLSISDVLRSYSLDPNNLNKARLVFNQIRLPNTFNWNWIIKAYSQSDYPNEAILCYNRMRYRGLIMNKLTFIFVFKACTRLPDIKTGKKIHGHCLKLGFESYLYVSNALIHMYSSCGFLTLAKELFDKMSQRDLVSWNTLICGYSQIKKYRDVLLLFNEMQAQKVRADAVTMVKVVLACSYLDDQQCADSMVNYIEENNVKIDVYLGNTLIDLYGRRGSVELARKVFDKMSERNVVSWNAMITGYAKKGDLVSAKELFDNMPVRDVISWTSMIAGYSQTNRHTDAVMLFREMMLAKVKPDEITVASVLSACAHLGSLEIGKSIHEYIVQNNIKADIYVGNSLIDMYCKCGSTAKAMEVFKEMPEIDEVSWTSIITGLAVNGYADDALECFSEMLLEGIRPRDVTFVAVLLACTHAGLVDKGLEYFDSMSKVHGLEPKMKHYGCVVDLLSRSGDVERAYEFIKKMPITPDAIVWRTLLSACKQQENVVMAEIVTQKLLELDPANSGNYVLLSNTYASADRWDDAVKVRNSMMESDVYKPPGCSSIEVNSSKPESVDKDQLPPLMNNQAIMR